jgi:hypothetical protein
MSSCDLAPKLFQFLRMVALREMEAPETTDGRGA